MSTADMLGAGYTLFSPFGVTCARCLARCLAASDESGVFKSWGQGARTTAIEERQWGSAGLSNRQRYLRGRVRQNS